MTFALHPDLVRVLTARAVVGAAEQPIAVRDDWKILRTNGEATLAAMVKAMPEHASIHRRDYTVRYSTVHRYSYAGTAHLIV